MSPAPASLGPIHLQPVGEGTAVELLDEIAARLAGLFRVSCHVRTQALDASFARDVVRGQYYSTAILERLAADPLAEGGARLLGITEHDLYVPVLTFVFGEAQIGGPFALVSLHRLREEFYGLPPRPELLLQRAVKEAVHELGHTFGLRHCADWRCVMASTHSVERLDVKSEWFCAKCLRAAGLEDAASPSST